MHRYVFASVTAFLALVLTTPVAAQEAGKVGVTMGFPESVGIIWHATDRVAVRPEFSFGWSSTDNDLFESDGTSFGAGLSALFYVRKWDSLATYVSPRYTFTRSTRSFEGPFTDGEADATSHLVSGSFGAQYWLGDRFSAFGEIGLGYSRSNDGDEDGSTGSSLSTRSSVGVVFYF